MTRREIEQLLGGYATGNLTAEERERLFTAALDDQELFDRLAREEPLRELLQDPVARGRLRAVLDSPKLSWYKRWVPAAVAAALAGSALTLFVLERKPREVRIDQIAQMKVPPVAERMPIPRDLQLPPLPERAAAAPRSPRVSQSKRAEPASPPSVIASLKNAPAATETLPAPPPAAPLPPTGAAPEAAADSPVRAQPMAGLPGGIGGVPPSAQNARALFYAVNLQPSAFRAQTQNRAETREAAPKLAQPAAAPAANLGLRYEVLRKLASGELSGTDPRDLGVGDEVVLRLEANDAGYLSVLERRSSGAWQILTRDQPLERYVSYTVPRGGTLTSEGAGLQQVFVLFSRTPLGDAAAAGRGGRSQLSTATPAEKATYVVSTASDAASQQIGFPITLIYR